MTGTCALCKDEDVTLSNDGVRCNSCALYLWHLGLEQEPLASLLVRKCHDCLGEGRVSGRMCYTCETFGVLIRKKSPLEQLAEASE